MTRPDPHTEQTLLDQITHHATTQKNAAHALRQAARQAANAGIPITRIAQAAGTSRQTIHTWQNQTP